MKHTKFSKKRLSASISLLLGSMAVSPGLLAQEETAAPEAEAEPVEVIQVKGILGSLARSQDIKRESSGIVDAISSEEMGKFPDTNLAESLNRITGVSISRTNNEGSEITVRGFGPSFNLLLLNGRQMPGTGNTRSFDLANLSSEGVETLEVYKSSKIDLPTGGLGATVNIMTAKPLNNPGLKYSFSAKGLYDEANELGDDVTPELAALYSQTFYDDKIGVSLSASYQERSFRQQSANVPGWLANTGAMSSASGNVDLRPDAETPEQDTAGGIISNGEAQGTVEDGKIGNTFFPRQISYDINDIQRERTNAHLTLQYAPNDNMTFTADYMYADTRTANEGFGFGIWFNFGGNVTNFELDENGTAVKFTEVQNDYAHSRTSSTTGVEQDSIGLNFEWFLNDDITLEFDYHDSQIDADNGLDSGTNAASLLIIAPNNIVDKTYDFTSGDIPVFSMTWPNGAPEASAGDIDPLFAQFSRGIGKSAVEQFQVHADWVNPNDSYLTKVKAGVAYTEQEFSGRSGFSGNQGPNGFNGNQGIFPDNMFTRTSTGDLLDQFDGGGGDIATPYYFDWDLGEALSRIATFFPNANFDPFNGTSAGSAIGETAVIEETYSAYVTSEMFFEFNDIPIDVNLGVRYEETETTSANLQPAEDYVLWTNPTEWQLIFRQGGNQLVEGSGEYDVFLPALDIRAEIKEDMFLRASVGKTLTRSSLGSLVAGRSLTPAPKPDSRTGSAGNPSLLPFESTNIDVTWEWYYDESSYVAVGYFRKDVENFISTSFNTVTFEGVRDPFIGPRAEEARAQLEAAGEPLTVTAIWDTIVANGGGSTDPCCEGQVVRQSDDDPLMEWLVSQPSNAGDNKATDGIEFAVSHVFGDTGYGLSFNATLVDTDAEYDIELLAPQEPLVGVSDSANFQAFYEDDEWSIKLTHTWRDDYLLGVGQTQGSADAPPQFVKETNITDFSVNYSMTEELTFYLEGYNIFNETEEGFGRYTNQFLFARQYGSRVAFGARYTFQ
jgi:TonB-dependent receptor